MHEQRHTPCLTGLNFHQATHLPAINLSFVSSFHWDESTTLNSLRWPLAKWRQRKRSMHLHATAVSVLIKYFTALCLRERELKPHAVIFNLQPQKITNIHVYESKRGWIRESAAHERGRIWFFSRALTGCFSSLYSRVTERSILQDSSLRKSNMLVLNRAHGTSGC